MGVRTASVIVLIACLIGQAVALAPIHRFKAVLDASADADTLTEATVSAPHDSVTVAPTYNTYKYPNYADSNAGAGWTLTTLAKNAANVLGEWLCKDNRVDQARMLGVALDNAAPPKLYWALSGDSAVALNGAVTGEIQALGIGAITFVKNSDVSAYSQQLAFKLGAVAVDPNAAFKAKLAGVAAIPTAAPALSTAASSYWNGDKTRIIYQKGVPLFDQATRHAAVKAELVRNPVLALGAKVGWGAAVATPEMVAERNLKRQQLTTEKGQIETATGKSDLELTAIAATDADSVRYLGNVYGTCAGSKLAFYRSLHGFTFTAFAERMVGPAHSGLNKFHGSCETCAVVIPPTIGINVP